MSVAGHRAAAPSSVPCFVLTVSDTRTLETDASGRAIVEMLESAGHTLVGRDVVLDDPARVAGLVRRHITDGKTRVVITTGGTGVSPRDTTYEAVAALIDKPLPGFGEIFRALSFQAIGSAAMLSRAAAGIAGRSVVFALPGSEHAVRLAMTALILPELGHLIGELDKR